MALIKVLVFKVGDRHLALLSNVVKEIIESDKTLKEVFYDKGGALKGLVSYEGDMVSVIDTAWALDFDNEDPEEFILLCKEREMEKAVSLTATTVVGMESIDTSKIKGTQDTEKSYSFGFLREGSGRSERIVTFLDLKKFLDYSRVKIDNLRKTGDINY